MMWVAFALWAVAIFAPIFAVPVGNQAGEGDDDTLGSEIFNGKQATPNSWPWMAQLLRNGRFVCGGTLIKRKWVVTAAHCVTSTASYAVVLGDHDRYKIEGTEQLISVKSVIIHPNYDAGLIENDIALLELSSQADTSVSEVGKVPRLATSGVDTKILDPDTSCYITGWGYETDNNDIWRLAPRLQELEITILSNTRCTDVMFSFNNPITNICYQAPLAASCNGDSGSPVVCWVNKKWNLVGVHSFKITLDGCRGGPKAGTRVSEFKSWIESII